MLSKEKPTNSLYSMQLWHCAYCSINAVVAPYVAWTGFSWTVSSNSWTSWQLIWKCRLKDLLCGLLRDIDFIAFILFIFLMQHWLEFTKSIAKQMKCKYFEFMLILEAGRLNPSSYTWCWHWCSWMTSYIWGVDLATENETARTLIID